MVVLTVFIFLLAVGKIIATRECNYVNETGFWHHEKYNYEEEICCDQGGVFPRKDKSGGPQGCCGYETFSINNQICCNGKKYNMTNHGRNEQFVCCGVSPINAYTHFCCGGVPRRKTRLQNACCAGNLIYNNSTKKCCQDYDGTRGQLASKSEECCGATPYNNKTHYCYDKYRPVKLFFNICGNKEYDVRDYVCCGSTLHTKPQNQAMRCCGSDLYDSRTEQCCLTSTRPFKSDLGAACCGKTFYYPQFQRCCNGVVHNASATQDCCGQILYDTRHEGCCAKKVYKNKTQQCCGWTTIAPKHQTCCGSTSFSPSTEVCCDQRFTIPKTNPEDTHCCMLFNTSYNDVLQECAPKRCGQESYNSITDLCCGGREVHKNGVVEGKRCCNPGSLMYDPATEICCTSEVIKKESHRNCQSLNQRKVPIRNVSIGQFEHYNICKLCQLNSQDFISSLKRSRINVCQKHIFRVKISKVRRVKNIRKQVKYSEIRVRLGKRINIKKGKDVKMKRRKVNLELLCECLEVREHMKFILLTNSDIDQQDIRLGDSDVIMPDNHELLKLLKAKLRNCPAVVQRKLSEIFRQHIN